MVETLSRHGHIDHLLPDLPSALVPTYSQLIEADVPEVLCRRLMKFVADELEPDRVDHPESIRAALVRWQSSSASRSRRRSGRSPGTRRIVALVGPTGVGKTTTVAKLAANLKLAQGVRVGLITVDTYRIAAVEQLKTYAEIIDLPLGRGQRPGRDAASARRAGRSRPRLHRHGGPQPARRGQDPRAGRVPATSTARRGSSRLERRGRPAEPAVGPRAVLDRAGRPLDPDQARRSRQLWAECWRCWGFRAAR